MDIPHLEGDADRIRSIFMCRVTTGVSRVPMNNPSPIPGDLRRCSQALQRAQLAETLQLETQINQAGANLSVGALAYQLKRRRQIEIDLQGENMRRLGI